jgi:hypothetical protein
MINADLEKFAPAKAARPLSQQTSQPVDSTGACIYMAGSRTKCELLSRPECEQLAGIWLPERDCSKILKMELSSSMAAKAARAPSRSGK